MLFIVHALDRPGGQDHRTRVRAAHLDYVASRVAVYRFGGPLLGDDGRALGSLMILDLPDRDALESHLADDPFFRSGLFQVVQVWQSVQVVPEQRPGALQAEIERQQRQALTLPVADPRDLTVHENATQP